MCVTYSPICDTDSRVYSEYLTAVKACYGSLTRLQLGGGGGCAFVSRVGLGSGKLLECGAGACSGSGVSRLECACDSGVVRSVGTGEERGSREWDGAQRVVEKAVESDCERGGCDDAVDGAQLGVRGVECTGSVGEEGGVSSPPPFFSPTSGVEPVVRGPRGGVSYGRGCNYERNLERRLRLKRKKKLSSSSSSSPSSFSASSSPLATPVRSSLEAKWIAENELGAARAKQQLELLCARDVSALKKKESVALRRQTERAMVDIEKAHMSLKATGNVPGFVPGFVEGTVVGSEPPVLAPSLSTGSISPDSSASQSEFRAAQLRILDLEAENARLKREVGLERVAGGGEAKFSLNSRSELNVSVLEDLDKRCGEGCYNLVFDRYERVANVDGAVIYPEDSAMFD